MGYASRDFPFFSSSQGMLVRNNVKLGKQLHYRKHDGSQVFDALLTFNHRVLSHHQ